jgi:hypothetical protein
MRITKFVIIISLFIHSCKSDLEKIDINNVEAHRAFQDSMLNKDSLLSGKFLILKGLINEYKSLNIKENASNSNYNYYLSRIYGKVDDFPLKGFWVDTINNKFLNETDYSNFYDSTFYYAERSLEVDKDNIRSMFVLSRMFYLERLRFEYNKSIMPVSYNRNSKKWGERINYITNNALRFQKIDTTKNRYLSRGICEVALNFIDKQLGLNGYNFDVANNDLVNSFYLYGQLWDYVKGHESVVMSFNKEFVQNKVYPNVLLARNYLKEKADNERMQEFIKSGKGFFIDNIIYSDVCKIIGPNGNCEWITFTKKNIEISFKRYYSGSWQNVSISGTYSIVNNNQLEVKWLDANSLSWKNIAGSSCGGGLTSLIQSQSFRNIISIDYETKSLKIKGKFSQIYGEGERCGDESRSNENEVIFQF